MAILIFVLVIAYCLSTSISIALLGDRKLISDLNNFQNIFALLINWKFILSMSLAVLSRITFILINNSLLKVSYLAGAATTISVFITLLSIVFIVIINHYFLNETLNMRQGIGAFIVLAGIFIMLSK